MTQRTDAKPALDCELLERFFNPRSVAIVIAHVETARLWLAMAGTLGIAD